MFLLAFCLQRLISILNFFQVENSVKIKGLSTLECHHSQRELLCHMSNAITDLGLPNLLYVDLVFEGKPEYFVKERFFILPFNFVIEVSFWWRHMLSMKEQLSSQNPLVFFKYLSVFQTSRPYT